MNETLILKKKSMNKENIIVDFMQQQLKQQMHN